MSRLRLWLDSLPGPLLSLLRRARTAALWALEPLDRVSGRLTRNVSHPVPPLWLRRHAGPVSAFEGAAVAMCDTLVALGLVREDDVILDIGCGAGAMALQFRRLLGPTAVYIGFDAHPPSIAWCKRHFADDRRFRFELAPLETPWSHGRMRPTEYRFPADDAVVGLTLAKSVFTHLLEHDAQHYLREIRRVLRTGRTAVVTAFLAETAPPAFPYGGPDVWWKVRSRPEAALAYRRAHFFDMVGAAGLHLERVIEGSWSGRGVANTFQDLVVLS